MKVTKEIVIGSGVLGSTLARSLWAKQHDVTLVNRHGGELDGHEIVKCDLANPEQLSALLGDYTRIYLCVAPAYSRWKQEFPALINGLCSAVKDRRVDIIYADNLYAYGPTTHALAEGHPQNATTIKGRVRAKIANQLMSLHGDNQVRVCIIRAADFFGPGVYQSVVGYETLNNVLQGKPAYLIGNPDMPHSLTYLPDFVRTLETLAVENSAYGQIWHVANSPALSLKQVLQEVGLIANQPLKMRVAGRFLLRVMGLFKADMRELLEMLYLFEQPLLVDHRKVTNHFAIEPTPLTQALEETMNWVRKTV